MGSVAELKKEMNRVATAKQAKIARWFFKTGPGEYGEGDQFIGIKVPVIRQLAKEYHDLPFRQTITLLHSRIHEHRMVALYILIHQFERGDAATQKKIYTMYLKNARYVNNWDLVDTTAPNIVGRYLLDKSRGVLYRLATSKLLWERRIAMLATYAFIREGDFTDALKIATILRTDDHDLMHKAVGWMVREVGNRERTVEEVWLQKYYKKLPRTTLRYAIEKFPEPTRKKYLAGTI